MRQSRWVLPGLLAGLLAMMLLALRGLDHAPAPVVPASDRTGFSAERAYRHLEDLIGDNVPHPPGSAAHRVVGERIHAKLREYGYEPEVQEGLKCSPLAPGCSMVRNIIAVRRGTGQGPAMMITAHYDSVPGSAAASDDGVGIAVMLEIADLLAEREPMLHDVVFLFADSEESGLRGAMLFADAHPLMKRVGLVVNLEARGASGPSAMFETGADNEALIRLFAGAVPRPVASSLLFEVYRRMPNNTDYTIYKRAGVTGFNFAFSRQASLYHSVRDDLAHVDRASLQHQGENALAVLLAAGAVPLESLEADGDASYVDVGTRRLLAWPASWNVPMALAGLLLVVVLAVWRAPVRLRTALWAVLAVVTVLVLVPLIGWLLSWPLGRWPDVHPLDHPYPWPGRIALLAASLLAVLVSARWVGRRAGVAATMSVTWSVLAMLSLALAIWVPGAAFMLLLPVLTYVLVGMTGLLRARDVPWVAAAAGFAVAVWSGLYHFLLADIVFGFQLSHLKVLPLLLFALPLLPLAVDYAERGSARAFMGLLVPATLGATTVAALLPAHTPDHPRGVNLVYMQEDEAAPRWLVESFGNPGREALAAMGFDSRKQEILRYGVIPREAHVKPAAALGLQPPAIEIAEDVELGGKRVIRGTVRSQREAYIVMLGLPAGSPVEGLRIEGQPVLDKQSADPRAVGLHGVGNAATRFEITARPGVPFALAVLDIAPLEASGEAARLIEQRPDTAAPLHNGDQSIALERIQF